MGKTYPVPISNMCHSAGSMYSPRCGNVRCPLATIPAAEAGDKLSLASVHCAALQQAGETAPVSLSHSDGELRLR